MSSNNQNGDSNNSTVRKAYVPPHLRGKKRPEQGQEDTYQRRGRPDDGPPRNDRRDDRRGGRDNYSRQDSRQDSRNGNYNSFGGQDGRNSGPRQGGNNRWNTGQRQSSKADINNRNERLELELFGDPSKRVKTGIDFNKYADIEVEVNGEDVPKEFKTWQDSKLHPIVVSNIEMAGYVVPTPVQQYAIPMCINNRDVMSCAQTGSGKTAGFLLPVIHNLIGVKPNYPQQDRNDRRRRVMPSCLVMAPTRELAIQIHAEAVKFTYRTGLRPVCVYGGQRIGDQLRECKRGCDIMIATPGRLWDMIERGMVSLQVCNYLVFDEADRMLDMGFEPQIRDIVDNCDMPPKGERQTAMFSATFPQNIQRLAGDFLTKTYIFLTIGRVGAATENVTQTVEYAQDNQKRDKLMQKLETAEGLTLIFVETKRNADGLERFISDQGIAATSIHGDRDQWEREQALKEFRSGRCPVLVATSVAARGLDIPNVVLVINYDTPNNIDDYVHRIGRTGRAGHHGMAVSFVNESTRILGDVLHLMEENKSEIAPWFKDLVRENRSYGGKKKGRKSNYGSRDYRNNRGGDRERGNDRGREQDRGYGGQSNRSSGQSHGYSNNSGRSDNSSWN